MHATSWAVVWVCAGAACAIAGDDATVQEPLQDTVASAREKASAAHADEPKKNAAGWIAGTWNGTRQGYPVTWRFRPDGRAYVEDRSAAWSVLEDTLRVDFDPIGESNMTERAVYRCLVSNPGRGPRRMYLLGFDLGNDGLLLTREFDPNDAEPSADTVDRSARESISSNK